MRCCVSGHISAVVKELRASRSRSADGNDTLLMRFFAAAIARRSKEAIRRASASTKPSSSASGSARLTYPYRSAVSGVQELVGGRLDVAGSELARLVPLERAGHLRIIAATGDRRSRTLPMLPTVAEQGLPGFDVDTWYGLFAPAGTPDTVIATLSRALAVALRAPEVVQLIDAREYEPLPNAPDDLRTLVIEETRRLRTLVQGNGIGTQR